MLSYGMVGGGGRAFIGAVHRAAIAMDQKARLVAGCFSRDFENTRKTGARLGIDPDRLYADFSEMARTEAARADRIDFVVITTPNSTHYPACKAFLEQGFHVVCEKPLVRQLSEALELKRLAEEKGVLFCVTYTYGANVTAKHAREIIRAGEIGEVRMVMGEYPQGWLAAGDGGKQGQWRCDPELSGVSNALGDIGTHIENTVHMMTGLKIKRLLAKMDVLAETRTLDDNSVVLIEYENGASGTYWASQIAIGCDNDLKVRIYGSKGAVEWSAFTSEDITVTGADGVRKLYRRGYAGIAPGAKRFTRLPAAHNEGYEDALANIYSNYIDCLLKQRAGTLKPEDVDYPGIDEGISGVKFIHKCIESNIKGNVWVDFE